MTSEQRSLIRFVLFYAVSTLILLSTLALFFYTNQKSQILINEQKKMQSYATEFTWKLQDVHQQPDDVYYPQHNKYRSAIYDSSHKLIFSDFTPPIINWAKELYQQDDKLFLIKKVKPHFLGTSFLIIATKTNSEPLKQLQKNVLIVMLILFTVVLLLSYFLGNQFIKPMRQSIELLDNFIKDTTHELNTPVSIILTNIEATSSIIKDEKLNKYMRRLEIAARTISNLYDSLTFLKLNHDTDKSDKTFNLSLLLQERLQYFELHFHSRKLKVDAQIDENVMMYANVENIRILIDNLLSNAIKYNKRDGKIAVILNEQFLEVADNGIGIPSDKLNSIQERFVRGKNSSEGGFGIGLHIVKIITKNYGYKLEIKSEESKGTIVRITW